MKSLLLFALCFFAVLHSAFSQNVQKADIRGVVIDGAGSPLAAGTVMLLHAKDSVLAGFAATSADGSFTMKNISAGNYLVRITYVGFNTITKPVSVGDAALVDLGNLVMSPASEVLNEVEVTADHIPIQMKKDTIEYNADAFQTQPNAVVEDLLKKLPGVEVAADGTIKAQGEEVQNVFVDGKEFFGTDPKMATKNLPAKAVKKVKVYDKMSEMAEFSGIDDGEREKSINLELKEDFKTGVFGTAEAGYGSDERFMVKTNLNKFTKKSQLSVLGLLNNVNEQGFSFEEYMNFSGGMRGMGRGGRGGGMQITIREGDVPISQGIGNGLTETYAGGVNYNFEVGKKLDFRTSYFFNDVNNDLLQSTFRQGFLNNETYDTYEDNTRSTTNQSHRLNLTAKYDIDSTQNIELKSNGTLGKGSGENTEYQETFNVEDILENTSDVSDDRSSDRMNFTGDLFYRKKLGQKGRSFTTNLNMNTQDSDDDTRLMAINEYLTTGNTEIIDQLQYAVTDNFEWGSELSYTEPIAKHQYLEVDYEYSAADETSVRDVFDVDGNGEQPNDALSTHFQKDLTIHRLGATWRLNKEKSTIGAGLDFQDTNLEGFVNQNESPVSRQLQSFLPNFRWRYEFATARNLRFDYRTNINVPSIAQLSPIVDNSDPLNISVGNPDLAAEYVHRANLHFHSFSQFSFTSIFAMISGTLTENKIVNSTVLSEQFVETTRPVNIDEDFQLTGYASFGTPLKFLKNRFQINGNVTYTNSMLPINGVNNDLTRWSRTFGVQFQSQNSEAIEYTVGSNWTQSTTRYSESETRNQDFFTHHYFADLTLNFLKSWSISTSMDYRLYTGDQFAENQALPIWKASVSKYVMEKRGQIRFSVFDLLDENKGLSRTSAANYIEEIRANSIGRYGMLTFLYSIRGFGQQGGMGGVRFIQERR